MLAIERRNEILQKLQIEKRVLVSELSKYYDVSEETIRRDLEKLATDGYAIKNYGGAIINENAGIEFPLNIRKNTNVIEKQKIAAIVSGIINDRETLMLDASSTALYVARALKTVKHNLTIITNSIEILIELLDVPEWTVISTGGITREGSFALVGPVTDRMLRSYHVDKAIISCKGMDMEAGITDSDEFHANIKSAMLSSARQKILLVDSSKFDRISFTHICGFDRIDLIVSDSPPESKWDIFFKRQKIGCLIDQEF